MKITQFKKQLSQHGTKTELWEGATEDEIKAFIAKSDEARMLFEDERKLDDVLAQYQVEEISDTVIDSVMKKIGADDLELKADATIHKFEARPKRAAIHTPFVWGGTAALAAGLFLFFFMLGGTPDAPRSNGTATRVAKLETVPVVTDEQIEVAENNVAEEEATENAPVQVAEIDELLVETVAEDLAQQEIISLWEMADAIDAIQQPAPMNTAPQQDIDTFLDSLYPVESQSDASTDPVLEQEMDLWELFLAGQETREL